MSAIHSVSVHLKILTGVQTVGLHSVSTKSTQNYQASPTGSVTIALGTHEREFLTSSLGDSGIAKLLQNTTVQSHMNLH